MTEQLRITSSNSPGTVRASDEQIRELVRSLPTAAVSTMSLEEIQREQVATVNRWLAGLQTDTSSNVAYEKVEPLPWNPEADTPGSEQQ